MPPILSNACSSSSPMLPAVTYALQKQGGKVKGPKDPGLPAQWPFKDELIKEFAWKRAQILADEKRKKEERKARRMVRAHKQDMLHGMAYCAMLLSGETAPHPHTQALHAIARASVLFVCCLWPLHTHNTTHPPMWRVLCPPPHTRLLWLSLMQGLADGADGEMAALQASATAKEVDFETRKRARIADDFQTDKGGCWVGAKAVEAQAPQAMHHTTQHQMGFTVAGCMGECSHRSTAVSQNSRHLRHSIALSSCAPRRQIQHNLLPPCAPPAPPSRVPADGSRKAFYKEFRRVVEMSDVVIQVLDARDPLACRCPDVERYIRSTSPNKKIILLLNKMGGCMWGWAGGEAADELGTCT